MKNPKFTEHFCIDCEFAKPDPNLPLNKKACQEGYGIRHDISKACNVFVAGVWKPKVIKGATI